MIVAVGERNKSRKMFDLGRRFAKVEHFKGSSLAPQLNIHEQLPSSLEALRFT